MSGSLAAPQAKPGASTKATKQAAAPAPVEHLPPVAQEAMDQEAEFEPERPRGHSSMVVGAADDPREREADAMADEVMRGGALRSTVMRALSSTVMRAPSGSIFRECSACKSKTQGLGSCTKCGAKREEEVMRKASPVPMSTMGHAGGPVASDLAQRVRTLPTRGLPRSVLSFMEPRFGRSLSDVRISTGPAAEAASEALGARAFTLDKTIAFGRGAFAPTTSGGRRLLAHEIAHTLQGESGVSREVVRRAPDSNDAVGSEGPKVSLTEKEKSSQVPEKDLVASGGELEKKLNKLNYKVEVFLRDLFGNPGEGGRLLPTTGGSPALARARRFSGQYRAATRKLEQLPQLDIAFGAQWLDLVMKLMRALRAPIEELENDEIAEFLELGNFTKTRNRIYRKAKALRDTPVFERGAKLAEDARSQAQQAAIEEAREKLPAQLESITEDSRQKWNTATDAEVREELRRARDMQTAELDPERKKIWGAHILALEERLAPLPASRESVTDIADRMVSGSGGSMETLAQRATRLADGDSHDLWALATVLERVTYMGTDDAGEFARAFSKALGGRRSSVFAHMAKDPNGQAVLASLQVASQEDLGFFSDFSHGVGQLFGDDGPSQLELNDGIAFEADKALGSTMNGGAPKLSITLPRGGAALDVDVQSGLVKVSAASLAVAERVGEPGLFPQVFLDINDPVEVFDADTKGIRVVPARQLGVVIREQRIKGLPHNIDASALADEAIIFMVKEVQDAKAFLFGGLRTAAEAVEEYLPDWAQPIPLALIASAEGTIGVLLDLLLALASLGIGLVEGIVGAFTGLVDLADLLLTALHAELMFLLRGDPAALGLLSEKTRKLLENLLPALEEAIAGWITKFKKASPEEQTAMIGRLTAHILEAIEGAASTAGMVYRKGKLLRKEVGGRRADGDSTAGTTKALDVPNIARPNSFEPGEYGELAKAMARGRGDTDLADLPASVVKAEADFVLKADVRAESWTSPKGNRYVAVVELPNGHKYRRRADGTWCRFSPVTCNISPEQLSRHPEGVGDSVGRAGAVAGEPGAVAPSSVEGMLPGQLNARADRKRRVVTEKQKHVARPPTPEELAFVRSRADAIRARVEQAYGKKAASHMTIAVAIVDGPRGRRVVVTTSAYPDGTLPPRARGALRPGEINPSTRPRLLRRKGQRVEVDPDSGETLSPYTPATRRGGYLDGETKHHAEQRLRDGGAIQADEQIVALSHTNKEGMCPGCKEVFGEDISAVDPKRLDAETD